MLVGTVAVVAVGVVAAVVLLVADVVAELSKNQQTRALRGLRS